MLEALERIRDTGDNTGHGINHLDELEHLVTQASPLDDELTDVLSEASTVGISTATLDRFGNIGNRRRNAFEDKAVDIRDQITLLGNERKEAVVSAFAIIKPEIGQGVRALKKKTKQLEAVVAALKTLNTLLGIVGKVISLV